MEKKWWTLVVVCAATFMLLLDVTIVIVALPTIQSGLHASFSEVQWVVDAYALTLASVLLTAGSLADRYGRRFLFTIGLIVFTLGSLLCGVAQSPIMLILSRSAQGIGGAILFATSLALLAQSFHGNERGVAFGVWGAITGVAVGLGPVLGGSSPPASAGGASSWSTCRSAWPRWSSPGGRWTSPRRRTPLGRTGPGSPPSPPGWSAWSTA